MRSVEVIGDLGDILGRVQTGSVVVDCEINHDLRHRSKMEAQA